MREIPSFVYDPSLVLYLPLWKRDGNSFISDDAYGYLATVTGAAWGLQGRTFDGTDDDIRITNPSFINDQTGTIEFWAHYITGGGGYPVSSSVAGSTDDEIQCFLRAANQRCEFVLLLNGATNVDLRMPSDSVAASAWSHIVWTSNGSTVNGYANSVLQSLTVSAGTNTGQWFGDATDADTFTIGGIVRATLVGDFNGIIGEVRVYSRALTALEIQRNYLATKWRYS